MIDKGKVVGADPVFAKTDRVYLTLACDTDRPYWESTLPELPTPELLGQRDALVEKNWLECLSDDVATFMVWEMSTKAFVGYCQYKALRTGMPEVAIELVEAYQGAGLGQEVCSCIIREFFARTDEASIYYRVFKQNHPSIHLVEKLGGELVEERRMKDALKDVTESEIDVLADFDTLIYRIDRKDWTGGLK